MKKVLVVDDSPTARKRIRELLVPPEFEIIGEASNGVETVKGYELKHPDFVTMDVTMPIADVLETSKRILQKDSHAKILLMSALGDEGLGFQAKEIGINGDARKPFKPEELIKAVVAL